MVDTFLWKLQKGPTSIRPRLLNEINAMKIKSVQYLQLFHNTNRFETTFLS